MSDSYIQNLFSERIGGVSYGKDTAIYKFEKIKRAKKAAAKAAAITAFIPLGYSLAAFVAKAPHGNAPLSLLWAFGPCEHLPRPHVV